MKKIFKSCSIYRQPQGFFVFGYMRTLYGGVGRPPVVNLPLTATPLDLGTTVLRILNKMSGEFEQVDLAAAMANFRAHLKDLGFKNVAAFEKKASVADVEFDGEFYSVVSTRKDEHGANDTVGSTKLPPTATAEELGNAILAAIDNPDRNPTGVPHKR